MTFIVNVTIRAYLELESWDVKGGQDKNKDFQKIKMEIQEALLPGNGRPGIAFAIPDPSSGGNSTTGQEGRTFWLNPQIRNILLRWARRGREEQLKRILHKICIIHR